MNDIYNVYDSAECIIIHNDGVGHEYPRGVAEYKKLLSGWKRMIKGAYDMPAFGVSLNRYTVEEMKRGVWVEFVFNEMKEVNGLPFEKLLINVRGENYGFNLIRFIPVKGYDGRCLYLDLNGKTMSEFAALISDLTV